HRRSTEMTTSVQSLVQTAFEVIGNAPVGSRDQEVTPLLRARGLSSDDARLVLLFLPIAFGRAVLRRMGVVSFSDQADVTEPDGDRYPILLSARPMYAAAGTAAAAAYRDGANLAALGVIAARSGEVAAAIKAKERGSPIAGGSIGPTLLIGLPRRLFVS